MFFYSFTRFSTRFNAEIDSKKTRKKTLIYSLSKLANAPRDLSFGRHQFWWSETVQKLTRKKNRSTLFGWWRRRVSFALTSLVTCSLSDVTATCCFECIDSWMADWIPGNTVDSRTIGRDVDMVTGKVKRGDSAGCHIPYRVSQVTSLRGNSRLKGKQRN